MRRFNESEKMKVVFDFIECQNISVKDENEEDGEIDDYSVLSNFPRKYHNDPNQSIAELKLGKQILLIVQENENEHSSN